MTKNLMSVMQGFELHFKKRSWSYRWRDFSQSCPLSRVDVRDRSGKIRKRVYLDTDAWWKWDFYWWNNRIRRQRIYGGVDWEAAKGCETDGSIDQNLTGGPVVTPHISSKVRWEMKPWGWNHEGHLSKPIYIHRPGCLDHHCEMWFLNNPRSDSPNSQ